MSRLTLCYSAAVLAALSLSACAVDRREAPRSIRALTANEAATYSERLRVFSDARDEKRDRELRRLYGDGEQIIVTASAMAAPASITNNQVEGVDEGDIIKRLGDQLILLRNGRLFSIDLGSGVGEARVQGYIDVEERTDDSESAEFETWYDEILVYEDTLILLGYSYRYSGAVIHRYRVRDEGSFERLDAIRLSSGDYFDTSNYATRIVGNQLIFYLPRPLLESSVGIDVHPIVNGEIQAPTGLRAVSWIA